MPEITRTSPKGFLEGEDFTKLQACVHCGLCLDTCPTYRALGKEADSPRGRLYYMAAVHDGRVALTKNVVKHIDLCLFCRACETICPSGVEFGRLMGRTREELHRRNGHGVLSSLMMRFVLRGIFAHPTAIRWTAAAMRLYQKSQIPRAICFLADRNWLPKRWGEMQRLMPRVSDRPFRDSTPSLVKAQGERRAQVALFLCCVNDYFLPEIDAATVRVLSRNGCDVHILRHHLCAGSLHIHSGDTEGAADLARANIDRLALLSIDAFIVNSAGCGAELKEYSKMLEGDSDYAERAFRFSRRVKDVSEFLAELGLADGLGHVNERVAYVDACHLAHAQKVTQPPRRLLEQIPGLELLPVPQADQCCGSAGIYNVVHFDLSMKILDEKMSTLIPQSPTVIATGNPGCLIQLAYGAKRHGLDCEVMHPIQILDKSYKNAS